MKGNKKLLVVAVLLLLVVVSYTTYAIYRSSANATGTIKAAAWSVKVKNTKDSGEAVNIETANLNFGVNDITWTTHTGKNDTIAPGDTGTLSFTVDATGSEVDVLLEAAVDTANANLPNGMTATVTSGTNGVQTITYDPSSMTATVVVTITWTGTTADLSGKDTSDKTAAGTNLSIPVTLTARQKLATD